MPVACAPAVGENASPASTATSTATSRRILITLPRFGGACVREVPNRRGIVPPRTPTKMARPAQSMGGPRTPAESEADAARDDECLATTDLAATLDERGQLAALHLERGAAKQVQPGLRIGDTDSP